MQEGIKSMWSKKPKTNKKYEIDLNDRTREEKIKKQKILRFLLNGCGILYLLLEKYIEYPDDDVILGLEIDTNLQKMSRNQLCEYMDKVSGCSGFYDLSSTTKIRYGCQLLKDFYNRFNLVETK
jgi:hypothetical protein